MCQRRVRHGNVGSSAPGRARCPPPSCRSPSAPAARSAPASVTWWRVAARARRQPRPAGRRQLRQRLQRRRAGHRRRRGSARCGSWRPAWRAGGGEAGGVAGVRRRRASPAWSLAATTSWWLLLVGAAAIAAAGSTPAVRGRTATSASARCSCSCSSASSRRSARRTSPSSESPGCRVVMGCAAGRLACALLVVNNLRDIPTDTVAGKRTLAVRLGDAGTRRLYVGLLAAGVRDRRRRRVGGGRGRCSALGVAAARRAARAGRAAAGANGPALIAVLGATGRLQLAFGVLADARPRPRRLTRSDQRRRTQSHGFGRAVEPAGVERAGRRRRRAARGGRCGRRPDDRRASAPGMQPRPSARRCATNLASSAPATSEHRHRQLGEAVPQRLLRAGAGEAQARRQPVGRVAPPVVEPAAVGVAAWRTAAGRATGEERLDAVALDRRRQLVVGRPPRGTLAGVVDAGGGARPAPAARRASGLGEGEVQARAGRPSSSRRTSPGRRRRRAASAPSARSARDVARPPWPGASTATTS